MLAATHLLVNKSREFGVRWIKQLLVASEDDFRSGCWNISHHYWQQSFSGLHFPGWSNNTITKQLLPDKFEYSHYLSVGLFRDIRGKI